MLHAHTAHSTHTHTHTQHAARSTQNAARSTQHTHTHNFLS